MKKISIEMAEALFNRKTIKKSNTEVEYILQPHLETSEMYLFNNLIARYNYRTQELQMFNCGWFSNTTKDRLSAILSIFYRSRYAYIRQFRFKWYVETPFGIINFEEGMTLIRDSNDR